MSAQDLKEETNPSASSNPSVGNDKLLSVCCCVFNTAVRRDSVIIAGTDNGAKPWWSMKPATIQKKPGWRLYSPQIQNINGFMSF